MIVVRVIRQVQRSPGVVAALTQTFVFSAAPTIGSKLDLATAPRPLEVVGVTLRPRADIIGRVPPEVDVYLEYETSDAEAAAREAGWQATA